MARPERDHRITLADAAALTRRYCEADPSGVKVGTFHRDQVLALSRQPGCVALRVHLGRHADGTPALVLAGVDQADDDLTDGTILQEHWPCPPICGAANPLNT
jgi:hypothetical protein